MRNEYHPQGHLRWPAKGDIAGVVGFERTFGMA
jgi:hypothetical protein